MLEELRAKLRAKLCPAMAAQAVVPSLPVLD
jgi:hypothetical protein